MSERAVSRLVTAGMYPNLEKAMTELSYDGGNYISSPDDIYPRLQSKIPAAEAFLATLGDDELVDFAHGDSEKTGPGADEAQEILDSMYDEE